MSWYSNFKFLGIDLIRDGLGSMARILRVY